MSSPLAKRSTSHKSRLYWNSILSPTVNSLSAPQSVIRYSSSSRSGIMNSPRSSSGMAVFACGICSIIIKLLSVHLKNQKECIKKMPIVTVGTGKIPMSHRSSFSTLPLLQAVFRCSWQVAVRSTSLSLAHSSWLFCLQFNCSTIMK